MDAPTVTIFVSGQGYQLPLAQVREAVELEHVTPVPSGPSALAGLVNLRGEVVPAVNLGLLLGRESRPPRPGDVLLVVEADEQLLALAVDRVIFTPGAPSGASPVSPVAASSTAEAPGPAVPSTIDARLLLGLLARAVAEAAERTSQRLVPVR